MKTTIIPLFLSLPMYSTKKVLHSLAIYLHIFFFLILYIAHTNLEQCSLISPFSIIVPQLATKLFFNSHIVSYNTCNRETHEKNLFNVKQTNSCNLNYKVIQLIIVLSLLLFQRCIQRSFVASSIVD